jgi:hypothetical protein
VAKRTSRYGTEYWAANTGAMEALAVALDGPQGQDLVTRRRVVDQRYASSRTRSGRCSQYPAARALTIAGGR